MPETTSCLILGSLSLELAKEEEEEVTNERIAMETYSRALLGILRSNFSKFLPTHEDEAGSESEGQTSSSSSSSSLISSPLEFNWNCPLVRKDIRDVCVW
jgi:hypothetical protein